MTTMKTNEEQHRDDARKRFEELGESRVRLMHSNAQLPQAWEGHAVEWLVEQEAKKNRK
jgi:hypothetical protein